MAPIRGYAAEYGRANAPHRIGPHPAVPHRHLARTRDGRNGADGDARSDRGGEEFLERTVFGTPEDVIERVDEYIEVGLDKFVLWPVAEPEAWAGQVELIGREIAAHYTRLAQAAA